MLRYDLRKLLNVSISGRFRQLTSGWSHKGSSLPDNMLVIIISGTCSCNFLGMDFQLQTHSCIIIPKNTYYTFYAESSCEYWHYNFDGDLVHIDDTTIIPSLNNDSLQSHDYIYLSYYTELDKKLDDILFLIEKNFLDKITPSLYIKISMNVYFAQMLITIALCSDILNSNERVLSPTLNKILYYIHQYYNEHITLNSLSEHFMISKQYIMRLFSKYLKVSVTEYITDLKLQHACYLLKHTIMNINEISEYLGFADNNYFARVFKKKYNITPSTYSKSYKIV